MNRKMPRFHSRVKPSPIKSYDVYRMGVVCGVFGLCSCLLVVFSLLLLFLLVDFFGGRRMCLEYFGKTIGCRETLISSH